MGFKKLITFERLPLNREVVDGVQIIRKEIAFNEAHLAEKLNGDMAIVDMPAKPWYVQMWRKVFTLKGIEIKSI